MKIIIPFVEAADNFQENVATTLRAMGHVVISPPRDLRPNPAGLAGFAADLAHRAFPRTRTRAEKWLVATAKDQHPDMVLCLTQALSGDVLVDLRRLRVSRLVAWWGDPPANMRGMGLLAAEWDAIFLKDAAAVAKFQAVGLPAEVMNEAMNPVWHSPVFNAVGTDVAVAGSYYGYRQYLALALMAKGVPLALYGPRPPRWAEPAIQAAHKGRFVVKLEKSRVFGSAIACLNSTTLAEGDSLNCRAFEIAGACGLQLIEDKPAVATCFEPGKEVLTYRSVDDILAHLDRARAEPAWAMRIREAGHRRALAEHTYEIRLRQILARVATDKESAA